MDWYDRLFGKPVSMPPIPTPTERDIASAGLLRELEHLDRTGRLTASEKIKMIENFIQAYQMPHMVGGGMPGSPYSQGVANTANQTMQGAFGAGQQQTAAPRWSLREKLDMRMGWGGSTTSDFHTVACIDLPDGKGIGVFVVTKDGQMVTVEDDRGMFPSDDLVTKLRMLVP